METLLALILAAAVSLSAINAKAMDAPGLAEGLALAGSLLESPAAALGAATKILEEEVVPAAQTEMEDMESPPLFEPPPEPSPEPELSSVPAETPAPMPEDTSAPPEGMGKVREAHYPQGEGTRYIPLAAGTIQNRTTLSSDEIAAEAAKGPDFAVETGSSEPQVLIMHTHTTESYETQERGWFDPSYTSRSTDGSIGVVAVGDAICQKLQEAGISTIHDTTLHDYPSYNGSYARSNETVRGYLTQHPSIKVVLDVHRDAIETNGERVAAVAEINGKKAAQVMIICGADKNGNLPEFRKNLGFAAAWETAMESRFHGLTRPVMFDYRYYNQDLTTGSLLIEVGSHGNTVEQAVYSGELVGEALAEMFR